MQKLLTLIAGAAFMVVSFISPVAAGTNAFLTLVCSQKKGKLEVTTIVATPGDGQLGTPPPGGGEPDTTQLVELTVDLFERLRGSKRRFTPTGNQVLHLVFETGVDLPFISTFQGVDLLDLFSPDARRLRVVSTAKLDDDGLTLAEGGDDSDQYTVSQSCDFKPPR